MAFAERYAAVLPGNLQDDPHHHATEVLAAAAIADRSARNIGALLHRVKYGNVMHKLFEGDAHALVTLQREWLKVVTSKGRERKWIKTEDIAIEYILFRRVAENSLAHYLGGICEPCGGTGSMGAKEAFKVCATCRGTRRAQLTGLRAYEMHLVEGMIAELESLESSHAGAATVLLRRGE